MLGEIVEYKKLRSYMSEELCVLRLKDIKWLMRCRNMTFEQAARFCLDTKPGSHYKERQNGSQPVVQEEILSIV